MTSTSATPKSVGSAVALTLAVIAALYAASWVFLPGIDGRALSDPNHPIFGSSMISRLSIMALGATPLVSAAVIIEIARILSARVRSALPGDVEDGKFKTVLFFLALAFTVVQARGIAIALEQIPNLVPEPGAAFRIKILLALVAATGAHAYAAHLIDRVGVGSGLWIVSSVATIASLPVLGLVTLQMTSDLGTTIGLAPLLFAIAVAGITLGLISKDHALASSGQLLWSSVVTSAAYALLMLPFAIVPAIDFALMRGGFAADDNTGLQAAKAFSLELIKTLSTPEVMMVLLPLLFVATMVLRERSLRRAGLASSSTTLQAGIILAVMTGLGIYAGAALGTAIRLDAMELIMLTVLGSMIMDRLRSFAS